MLGAFCVPEPLGTCLLVVAVIWWLRRKLYAPTLPSVAFDHEPSLRKGQFPFPGNGIPTARDNSAEIPTR
jgi:hypothetical protein